jgi:aminomethyltransferase
MTTVVDAALQRTPLYQLHVELGARIVPFAGYEMPLQYRDGILKEHLHTRASAGLFDVSHMGQIAVRPRSGLLREAAQALERLLPADICGLAAGRQRYSVFTSTSGGVLDDLMVANCGDHFSLVVNAARKHADEAYLREQLTETCHVDSRIGQALLAIQGPSAEEVLVRLNADLAAMKFMDVATVSLADVICTVSRSGYTGEDGFEISVGNADAERLARRILGHPSVKPIGLGARDSLRLEAGLCLYGSDLDESTTPVEAGLEWCIPKSRRPQGIRSGGFPGADVILHQLVQGVSRRRVALRPDGRAPVRSGTSLFADEATSVPAGVVTSGGFGPSADAPIAMGYVTTALAKPGTPLKAEVRGKRIPITVCEFPFFPHRYKRYGVPSGDQNAQVH